MNRIIGEKYKSWPLVKEGIILDCSYSIRECPKLPNGPNYFWEWDRNWNFTNTLKEAEEQLQEFHQVKLYSPQDIYDLGVDLVEYGRANIEDFLQKIDMNLEGGALEDDRRIEIKTHSTHKEILRSIWFDNIPIVLWVGFNSEFYITNEEIYRNMINYLSQFIEIGCSIVPVDKPFLKYYQGYEILMVEIIEG